jgi:hypothetical protein
MYETVFFNDTFNTGSLVLDQVEINAFVYR